MTKPLWICLTPDEQIALSAMCNDEASAEQRKQVLDRLLHYEGTQDERFVEAARNLSFMRDGECEVDDHATVSDSEDGAYVMAWAWVDRTEVDPDYDPS